MENRDKLITVAIHTYEKALILKTLLEKEGISVVINNVNLIQPVISSGVRVRINERDLPLALKIIESSSIQANETEENIPVESPRILVPIDFSDYSKKACDIGFDFAKRLGGEAILLHSFLTLDSNATLPFTNEELEPDYIANIEDDKIINKLAHTKMREFEKTLEADISAKKLPAIKFSSIITEGVPETSILYSAKQKNASLIVMGTRGKSKKEAELIGSVSAEVLDAGKFPVFTVPEGMTITKVSQITNVVFFSNLNQQDLISFDEFARLFKENNLNVTIVPIPEKKENANMSQYLTSLLQYCKAQYPEFSFSSKYIADAHFLDDFDAFVSESKIDLILVPNKKRNIFARLFNPSIAHRMLFHSDVPMLVVPIS